MAKTIKTKNLNMAKQKILKRVEEGMKENSRCITRDIMESLEKFNISPVISINGKIKNLKLIAVSKLKKFRSEIEKWGYSESDFWLAGYDQDKVDHCVMIISKLSGKSKEYKINHNNCGLTAFAEDLKQGFYK